MVCHATQTFKIAPINQGSHHLLCSDRWGKEVGIGTTTETDRGWSDSLLTTGRVLCAAN